MKYITVLTIAGSDPSGGAGIQADIKTISALGGYAASAITALTVQNTVGVTDVMSVTPEIVAGQINAVITDIKPMAIKIGMVNDRDTIHSIAQSLKDYKGNIIIDPVMVSTSGHRLMAADALTIFMEELLPIGTLLTPNIPEAEILSDMGISAQSDTDEAANRILSSGCKAVLIKGGHIEGDEKNDILYTHNTRKTYSSPTVETRNTHGTGCTLSAAIATFIARGYSIEDAITNAKAYVYNAIKEGAGMEIGSGHGPVKHFFSPLPTLSIE